MPEPSYLYVGICLLAVVRWGTTIGYTSVFVTKAQSFYQDCTGGKNGVLIPLYDVSGFLGSTIGALVVTFILSAQCIQRRTTIFLCALVGAIGWGFVMLGGVLHESCPGFLVYELVFHAFTGITSGGLSVVIPLTLPSIARNRKRIASYGTAVQVAIEIGILLMWATGILPQRGQEGEHPWAWEWVAAVGLLLDVLVLCLIWVIPYVGDREEGESFGGSHESWRVIIKVCGMHLLQQFAGINIVLTRYVRNTFKDGEMSGRVVAFWMALSGIQVITTIVSGFLLEKGVSRRLLWVISSVGCAVSGVGLALGFELENTITRVIFAVLYMACFGLGLGPIPWYFPSESLLEFSSSVQAKGLGACAVVNWASAFIFVALGADWTTAPDAWDSGIIGEIICPVCCVIAAVFGWRAIDRKDPGLAEEPLAGTR